MNSSMSNLAFFGTATCHHLAVANILSDLW